MGGGAAGPRVPPGLRGSLIGGVAGTASSRSIETLRYLPDLPGVVALGDSRAEARGADPGALQAARSWSGVPACVPAADAARERGLADVRETLTPASAASRSSILVGLWHEHELPLVRRALEQLVRATRV